jgi:sRNA-binding protein
MTDPQRTIALLIERFPSCFDATAPRPLAIGIFHDLRRAEPKIDSTTI